MTAVTLACPHCAGNIQVDTDYAGQQVGCPLCHNALMLPPIEVLAQFLAAAAPAYQPPPQEPVFTLGCPVCNNPLQVTAAMSGHQVGCPSCNTPIMVPPLSWPGQQPGAPSTEVAAEAVVEQALAVEPEPDVHSMLPPGAAPLPLPPAAMPPPAVPKPAAPTREVPAREQPSRVPPTRSPSTAPSPGADRMPPGADRMPPSRAPSTAPKSPAAEATRSERSPPATERVVSGAGRMPPGADRLPPKREAPKVDDRLPPTSSELSAPKPDDRLPPPRRPTVEPRPETIEAPSKPAAATQNIPPTAAIDDLLPPGALPPEVVPPLPLPAASASAEPSPAPAPSSNVDAFLPPGAAPAMPLPVTLPSESSAAGSSALDQLLPPGATDLHTAAVGQPTSPQPTRLVDSLLPPGTAAGLGSPNAPGSEVPLPVSSGGPLRPVLVPGQTPAKPGVDALQVQGREGKKPRGEEEMEIRKLTDKERASRRLRRNAVMVTILLGILFAVFYWMSR
ncbi:hypothetical protein NA78x_000594 [Anatilimnocola sp. NA78]|uniref:hypothetical protein n=1 Tax=Anatilimnocola sp. NA78 TaxID=3415683 RepID=UPI003CE4ACB1